MTKHNTTRFILSLLFITQITACGGGGSGSAAAPSKADSTNSDSSGNSDSIVNPPSNTDNDGDGILNSDDPAPNDPNKPVKSTLWGAYGESWTPSSRLPFVALAGYHEGKDPLPTPTRIVANVADFGATNTEGSANDTSAFQSAISAARLLVSANNPGVIYVPAGVYDIDEQLHLNVSGLILRGDGVQSRLRFSTGLVNSTTAIGSTPKRRKLIVMGGNYDSNSKLKAGINWQQYNSNYSAALDTNNLPVRGDFSFRLAQPLSATLKQNIIAQGNRIRLAQALNYGESSTTPKLAASIYGGPDFAASGSNGSITVSQQFTVTISADDQTLLLDRPLRFSPSNETLYSGARIAVRDNTPSWDTEEIGVEHLSIELPATNWTTHFGTEGQGGIEVMSDNSWVRNIKLTNADNGIEVNKSTFNNTITNITISGNRVPRLSGPAENRYDAYGHHGITLTGRDHKLSDFKLEVSYVHDITMNNCHGCVVMRGQAPQMNMDHHRQGIYSSLWTELNLGSAHRMWNSTGNNTEGFNSSAFNTYWNISSNDASLAAWPENGEAVTNPQPEWGYHFINIVATDIKSKPQVGEGRRPYPYHPDNAHLETMPQADVWPKNIYEAQLNAYRAGTMSGMPQPKSDY